MKTKTLKTIVCLSITMMLTACGAAAQTPVENSTPATAKDTATTITEQDIIDAVNGIKDITVEKNTNNIDYMKDITYDTKLVSGVNVKSDKVDTKTTGEYVITYTILPVDKTIKDQNVNANVIVTEKDDIMLHVDGLKDWSIEEGTKDTDFMKDVTYDNKYVKNISVNKDKVDVNKVGKYDIVYTITAKNNTTTDVTKTVTVNAKVPDMKPAASIDQDLNTTPVSDNTTTSNKPSSQTQSKPTSSSSSTNKPSSTPSSSTNKPVTPTGCSHNWVTTTIVDQAAYDDYGTRWVEDTPSYDETVVVKEAWTETIQWWYFPEDGYKAYSADDTYAHSNALRGTTYTDENGNVWRRAGNFSSGQDIINHPAETTTVHHEATGHNEQYVTQHHDAVTHTETKCSKCGATK